MILRGEVYDADLGYGIGSEQGGVRPVVIIQNDIGNRHSPTVVVASITSSQKKYGLPIHVRIAKGILRNDSVVLCEQIRVIDKKRLKGKIGKLSKEHMLQINKSLITELDLK